MRAGDTAAELRATRAWDADRNLLDAQGGSLEVARKLLADAPPAEASVLLEQLPKYFAAKNIDVQPVIQAEVKQKYPQVAEAASHVQKAAKHAAVLKHSANMLRRGFASGTKIRAQALVDPAKVK